MNNLSEIQEFKDYDNLEFIAKQVVEGFITGLHRSPFHGFSVEFAEHRLYNQGESTRSIDWKLYARTDRLYNKRYEEETNLRAHIIIDTSGSMRFPLNDAKQKSKLAFSVYCASALIYLLRKQRDAVGLTFFDDNIKFHSDSRLSVVHAKRLYAELNKMLNSDYSQKQKTKTLGSTLLHQISETIHQRSLVIIFSDMLDSENQEDLLASLQHLRHNKHEVILFHVSDKSKEAEMEFQNRPYRFVDLESGSEVKFNPNDVRTEYKQAYEKFFQQIKEKCGQYKIDFIEADINQDFKHILWSYLIKRSKQY